MKYLVVLLLAGCASFQGVQMDDAERKACAIETCSVWTIKELQELARKFFLLGRKSQKESI